MLVPFAGAHNPSLTPQGKPALTFEKEFEVALASKYVDNASPIPETKNLVGAFAITVVSIKITVGLCQK